MYTFKNDSSLPVSQCNVTHVKLSLSNFNNEDNNENYKKSGSK